MSTTTPVADQSPEPDETKSDSWTAKFPELSRNALTVLAVTWIIAALFFVKEGRYGSPAYHLGSALIAMVVWILSLNFITMLECLQESRDTLKQINERLNSLRS